jgi:multiple sugar transport system substrate-binding protein
MQPRHRRLAASVAAAALLAGAAACSSSGSGGSGAPGGTSANTAPSGFKAGVLDRAYAGQTISVLLPPWGDMAQSQLAKFTAATGIKVNLQQMAWDSIHDKVVSAEAAGVAPADVTEVDWSWVGQFGAAGWYAPLNDLLPKSLISGSPVASNFSVNGQQIAMPYNIDFRGMSVNMTLLKKAGITTPPATWADLLTDAKQIKAKGVLANPVGIPLSVTEGTSTPWYALIKSAGGSLLNSSGDPAFSSAGSAGAQALGFEASLYKDGLIPAGEVNLTDQQTSSLFASGQVAIELSYSPSALGGYLTPSTSKVAKDDIEFAPIPGTDGTKTGTFGLPEGLGIPKQSSHQGAAAMFIYWWEQLPQLLASYDNPNMGNLPPLTSALSYLNSKGKLVLGSDVMAILPSVSPLFEGGAPVWYPQFSTDVATMIQNVVEGKASAASALSQLASQAQSLKVQS